MFEKSNKNTKKILGGIATAGLIGLGASVLLGGSSTPKPIKELQMSSMDSLDSSNIRHYMKD